MEYNMPPNEDDKERVAPQGPRMLPSDWRSAPPFWDNFVGVLKRYTEFKGRASRKEYWLFQLMYFIIMWAVSFRLVGTLGVNPVGKHCTPYLHRVADEAL